MPELLAISANSPFLDGRHSGLHSARTQIFTKSFPRCGIPDAFGGWQAYADYIDFLVRTDSIIEFTQVWWSVRPHHSYGTVEMRICDAQTSADDSTALAALITSCVAQAALDHDEGAPFDDPPRAADRGELLARDPVRARRQADRPGAGRGVSGGGRARPAAGVDGARRGWRSGIEVALPEENGAQRQKRQLAEGATMEDIYAAEVALTQRTYAAEEVAT